MACCFSVPSKANRKRLLWNSRFKDSLSIMGKSSQQGIIVGEARQRTTKLRTHSLKNVCLTTIVPFRFLSLFYVCVLWKLHIIFCAPFARVSNNVFEWSYFIVECFIVAMYYVQRKKRHERWFFRSPSVLIFIKENR